MPIPRQTAADAKQSPPAHPPVAIPATVQLDPAAIAALLPAYDANILRRVEALLIDVRDRLAGSSKLLFSAAEVAEQLGVCARTVTMAAAGGELACVSIGARRLFSPADVAAFVEKNRKPSNAPATPAEE